MDSVGTGQYKYYVIVPDHTKNTLTVTVTPLNSGDPDLYCSKPPNTQPTGSSYDWAAVGYGADTVSIPISQTGDVVYCGVHGYITSNFTIVASQDGIVDLVDGLPQSGIANYGIAKNYLFVASNPSLASSIAVVATPLQGMVAIYVVSGDRTSNYPVPYDPSTYDWASTHQFSGESISIYRNDPKWPYSSHSLLITVVGLQDNSIFSLVAASNTANIVLRDGIPQQDNIIGGQYDYFQFSLSGSNCAMTIAVTAVTGDPDIYVSTLVQYPNSTHYEQRAYQAGSDQIDYSGITGPKTYFISVYAYSNTSFSIIANTLCQGDTTSYMYLIDGMPQHHLVSNQQWRYYQIDVRGHHRDVTISTHRRYGNPDLYITANATFGRPSTTNYLFKSTNSGDDAITITSAASFCNDNSAGNRGCLYYIGVRGSSFFGTSYDITASTSDAIVTLQDGVPHTDNLAAGEYEYFRLPVTLSGKPITISVTDLGRGDPDLFVSTTVDRPNRTHYTWSAATMYNDSVTIAPTDPQHCSTPCTYFIAVYAYSNTSFTLMAQFSNLVRLGSGVPQVATVPKGAMSYFQFQVEVAQPVHIGLTSMSGYANLYVSSNGLQPMPMDPSTYQWSAYYWASDRTITIAANDPKACTNSSCIYDIGVSGVSESTFYLVATAGRVSQPLQNGRTISGELGNGEYAYFVAIVDAAGFDVSIIVTAISGDPDLFVSTKGPFPNITTAERHAMAPGGDIIEYERADAGNYWISVMGYTSCSYTITVLMVNRTLDDDRQNLVRLVNGGPQFGTVYRNRYKYYSVDLTAFSPGQVPPLTVTLTYAFGDPDIYMSTLDLPNSTFYTWHSSSAQTDQIYLPNPVPAVYFIGVHGYSTSNFTLVASTGITELQEGVAFRTNVTARAWQYYSFYVTNTSRDLSIILTPFSGDPDLVMSRATGNPDDLPNNTHHEWSSTLYQGDAITVPHTDSRLCLCTYIIGVYGYTAASYSLVAVSSDFVQLQDGQPQAGQVAKGAFAYYRIEVPDAGSDITFSVTPLAGNPQLFISNNDDVIPTLTDYTRKSYPWQSSTAITFHRTDDDLCNVNNCVYWVGVYGYTASNYSVVAATAKQAILLQDGVPVRDWIGYHQWEYFTFQVNSFTAGVDAAFIITPLSGDPDLYVSSFWERPTMYTNETWSSANWGADAVFIPNVPPATYHIGVYAYTANCSFTITATLVSATEPGQSIVLSNGVPQSGYSPAARWVYYRFYMVPSTPGAGITISVSSMAGDPDLFVSNDGEVPTFERYRWMSSNFGQDVVVIPHAEEGEYLIGVYAYTTAIYDIIATTTDGIITLQDGVPHFDYLESGNYEYFQLNVDRTNMDLTVTVTPDSGDPDLFMSTIVDRPNSTHYEWKSQMYRDDSITVPQSRLRQTTYWMSVYAFTNTSYSIVASFSNLVRLQAGQPQFGDVRAGASKFFSFDVLNDATDVSIFVTPFNGTVFVYVSTVDQPDHNNASSYYWSSFNFASEQSIIIRSTDPHFVRSGRYYVSILGVMTSQFSILASTRGATKVLVDGVAQRDWLDTAEWNYYTFELLTPGMGVVVTITPFSGDPDLYIASPTSGIERPNRGVGNYTWRSLQWGADAIYIDPTDPHYSLGRYSIGAYGYNSATYTIMAQKIDVNNSTGGNHTRAVLLFQGQPQSGFVRSSESELFYEFNMPLNETRPQLYLQTRASFGSFEIFVSSNGQRASETNYQWIDYSGSGNLIITNKDAGYCTDCIYRITVKPYSASLFTIRASLQESTIMVRIGEASKDYVKEHDYMIYAAYVDYLGMDTKLSFALTVLSDGSNPLLDAPDVYVAHESTTHAPGPERHDYMARGFGDDILTIPAHSMGYYYIAVYCARNTTFYLTVSRNDAPALLTAGEPQRASVAVGSTSQFYIYVPSFWNEAVVFTLALNDSLTNVRMMVCSDCNAATPETSRWNNMAPVGPGSQPNQITILPSDPHFCLDCTYFVAVQGLRSATPIDVRGIAFTLVAHFQNQYVTLPSSIPFMGSVAAGADVNFQLHVDAKPEHGLIVDATAFVGKVAISVTNSRNFKEWTGTQATSSGSSHLTIPASDPDFLWPIVFYVRVHGVGPTNASFSLVSSLHSSLLLDGIPQTSQIVGNGSAFFYFLVDKTAIANAAIQVYCDKPLDEFRVFIATDPAVIDPSEQRHAIKAYSAGEVPDPIFLGSAVPSDCYTRNACVYTIGVYGAANSFFTIKASTGFALDYMQVATPMQGSVNSNQLHHFTLPWMPAPTSSVSATLEPCTGSAFLYISQNAYMPDQNTPNVHRSELADDVNQITLLGSKGQLGDGSVYIGVKGSSPQSRFRLTVDTQPMDNSLGPRPGRNGGINVDASDSSNVKISFTGATTTANPSGGADLQYTIYAKDESESGASERGATMFTKCGVQSAQELGGITTPNMAVTFTTSKLSGSKYTFNVMVLDPQTGRTAIYKPAYNIVVDTPAGLHKGIIIFFVAAAVMAIALVVYLWLKNRRLTQIISRSPIQMQEASAAYLPSLGFDHTAADAHSPTTANNLLLGAPNGATSVVDSSDDSTASYAYMPPELPGTAPAHSVQ